jgi:hypothetical protein
MHNYFPCRDTGSRRDQATRYAKSKTQSRPFPNPSTWYFQDNDIMIYMTGMNDARTLHKGEMKKEKPTGEI